MIWRNAGNSYRSGEKKATLIDLEKSRLTLIDLEKSRQLL